MLIDKMYGIMGDVSTVSMKLLVVYVRVDMVEVIRILETPKHAKSRDF